LLGRLVPLRFQTSIRFLLLPNHLLLLSVQRIQENLEQRCKPDQSAASESAWQLEHCRCPSNPFMFKLAAISHLQGLC
jgi:hypothetical protein